MDELRKTALEEYRREGPPGPVEWWVWPLIPLAGFVVYVFIEGLKVVFRSL